jgi:hypothetical protein
LHDSWVTFLHSCSPLSKSKDILPTLATKHSRAMVATSLPDERHRILAAGKEWSGAMG